MAMIHLRYCVDFHFVYFRWWINWKLFDKFNFARVLQKRDFFIRKAYFICIFERNLYIFYNSIVALYRNFSRGCFTIKKITFYCRIKIILFAYIHFVVKWRENSSEIFFDACCLYAGDDTINSEMSHKRNHLKVINFYRKIFFDNSRC